MQEKEISIEDLARAIIEAKKERITKRETHRANKKLGTLEEELDKIDWVRGK